MLKVPLLIAQEIRKYLMSETTFYFSQLCAQLIVLQFFFVQKQRKYKKEKNSPKVLIISLALIMCCYKFEVCRNTSTYYDVVMSIKIIFLSPIQSKN